MIFAHSYYFDCSRNKQKKMVKKHSVIWEFFVMDEDTKYTVCNTCQVRISRGGSSMKSYATTNLVISLNTRKWTNNVVNIKLSKKLCLKKKLLKEKLSTNSLYRKHRSYWRLGTLMTPDHRVCTKELVRC